MTSIRVIALPTETAKQVLATMKSPGYGHPAHTAEATGHGPCRHCLRPFRVGEEKRTLFTYNPFHKLAPIPLLPARCSSTPTVCERFNEGERLSSGLLPYPVVLDGYDGEQPRRGTDSRSQTADWKPPSTTCWPTTQFGIVMVRD